MSSANVMSGLAMISPPFSPNGPRVRRHTWSVEVIDYKPEIVERAGL